jgi:hypothetical protein
VIAVIVCLLAVVIVLSLVIAANERDIDQLTGDLFITGQALASACADLRLVDERRAAHADRVTRAFGGES